MSIPDRWSPLILRDMMFGGKRHFRELLRSEEGISSNILQVTHNRPPSKASVA
jgi:DNA-binding HxlR family transcriptional regulator